MLPPVIHLNACEIIFAVQPGNRTFPAALRSLTEQICLAAISLLKI
jgi:hypothetical protein